MSLKITNIHLTGGESFAPSPITIIVGANNSGKTRLLKEINQYLQSEVTNLSMKNTDLVMTIRDRLVIQFSTCLFGFRLMFAVICSGLTTETI